jgi:hypothetical protein
MAVKLTNAINLLPVIEVLALIAGACVALFIGGGILVFLLRVLGAPFSLWSSKRSGQSVDEFDEIIVFWGGLALVVALIVAAFHFHVVTLG